MKFNKFKQSMKEEYQCDELKLLVLENVEQKLIQNWVSG